MKPTRIKEASLVPLPQELPPLPLSPDQSKCDSGSLDVSITIPAESIVTQPVEVVSELPAPAAANQEDAFTKTAASAIESAQKVLQNVVFGPDGRFLHVVRLNRKERQAIRSFEPNLDTFDLEVAKELLRLHLYHDRIWMANAGFTLKEIRDRHLYSQGGFLDFTTWLKIESKDIGISTGYAYQLLNIADALDRYLILTFMGQWRMSIEDVFGRMKKLQYFMTGIYRHRTLEELKEPFIADGGPQPFINFVMGKTPLTEAEVEAAKAKRHQAKSKRASLDITSEPELEIVEAVKLRQEVVIEGLKDPKDAAYIKMALLAIRRHDADAAFTATPQRLMDGKPTPRNFTDIETLVDAKYMLLYHQAEGIPHRLVCACTCARLEDVPALVKQWRELGYATVHEFLIKELGITFDSYRYVIIGRNYLEHEATILRYVAIDTEIMFSKLYHLNTAIETHGDEPELIWRYFGPGTTVADWEYFAQHKDFQSHFSEKPMSDGQIKQARKLIFEFKEFQGQDKSVLVSPSSLAGDIPHVFPIVTLQERFLIKRLIENPHYLNMKVQLFFEYQRQGKL
jgi:hypothetical protein